MFPLDAFMGWNQTKAGWSASPCSTDSIAQPQLAGAENIRIFANPRTDYVAIPSLDPLNPVTIDFCNVTVHYSHEGVNDSLTVQIWLPTATWNGRLQGIGGGGYAGIQSFDDLAPAVAAGYSAVGSDLGHAMNPLSASSWALDASGEVNEPLLMDFAYDGLNDASVLGKQITQSFYGAAANYTYWNGCSTGGRQGMMLAQRYPDAYGGIVAAAPAINWDRFLVAEFWPQFVMNQAKHYPSTCKFGAFVNASITSCDQLDGAADNLISHIDGCTFDPSTVVGKIVTCAGAPETITPDDATVVKRIMEGPTTEQGEFLWWGLQAGQPFSGLANTICVSGICSGLPFPISADWISLFIKKDPNYDVNNMTWSQYIDIFQQSSRSYHSIIGTDNPDLSGFRAAGGKIIHWHGLSDQLIFPQGSSDYFKRAEKLDPSLRDFYRYFEAPGVEHCGGGNGPIPSDPLDALVNWVEKGQAPDELSAVSADGSMTRNLCPYPLVPRFEGGNVNAASSFTCSEHF